MIPDQPKLVTAVEALAHKSETKAFTGRQVVSTAKLYRLLVDEFASTDKVCVRCANPGRRSFAVLTSRTCVDAGPVHGHPLPRDQ